MIERTPTIEDIAAAHRDLGISHLVQSALTPVVVENPYSTFFRPVEHAPTPVAPPPKPTELVPAEIQPDGSIKPAEAPQSPPKPALQIQPPAQPRPPRIMRPRRAGGFVQGWR